MNESTLFQVRNLGSISPSKKGTSENALVPFCSSSTASIHIKRTNRPGLRIIPRRKADFLYRGGIFGEGEVICERILEQRILEHAFVEQTHGLHLHSALALEEIVAEAVEDVSVFKVVIQIFLVNDLPFLKAPVGLAVVGKDDIAFQHKARVILLARGADFRLAREREDVVSYQVFLAVMLVQGVGEAVVNQVVLHREMRGALIQINAPAAVAALVRVGGNIVNHVAAGDGIGLDTQGVNAAHIRKPALADVVNQIAADLNIVRHIVAVAPDPAAGNGGVVAVVNFIVGDFTAVRVNQQHADGVKEAPAVAVNVVVADLNAARDRRGIRRKIVAVDINGVAADISEQIGFGARILHISAETQGGIADVPEAAAAQRDVRGVVDDKGAVHVIGRLRMVDVRGKPCAARLGHGDVPIRIAENQALKGEAAHTVDAHKGIIHARAQGDAFGLPRKRNIIELCVRPVKIPLARLIEGLLHIFQEAAVVFSNEHARRAREHQLAARTVKGRCVHDFVLPVVQDADIHIRKGGKILQIALLREQGAVAARQLPEGVLFGKKRVRLIRALREQIARFGVARAGEDAVSVIQGLKIPVLGTVVHRHTQAGHTIEAVRREARNFLRAAQLHRFAGHVSVGDIASVRRAEQQRLRQKVGSALDPNRDRRTAADGFQRFLGRCDRGIIPAAVLGNDDIIRVQRKFPLVKCVFYDCGRRVRENGFDLGNKAETEEG